VGLPAGRTDEIFNAFFGTKLQGAGLGLAITRSILDHMAGGSGPLQTPNEAQRFTSHCRSGRLST